MKKRKSTLVILDAHALIHRSFHALPSFTSPSGEPMGAVYGVSAVLLKLIRELEPTHIAAAFDREEPTFRHIAYENYKATRKDTKSDLIPQFDKTKELFTAFGIPIYEVAGFEADDIIGTLVEKYKDDKDLTIIIASGDMDTLQLVRDDRVLVYTLRKGIEDTILYDEKLVKERFGFEPPLIRDYKGLKGDPSDNIIGVKGIGEKTATQIIQHYGTIESLYKKLKKEKTRPEWLKERIAKLLLDNEEEALFSKELATIRLDAPVSPKLEELAFTKIPVDAVSALFRKFHFPSLIARIPVEVSPEKEEKVTAKQLTRESWQEFYSRFADAQEIILYTQDEKLFLGSGKILYELSENNSTDLLGELKDFFTGSRSLTVFGAKEIYHKFSFIRSVAFDNLIALWVCDSEKRSFELADCIQGYEKAPLEGIAILSGKLKARIEKENLHGIYFDIELPLTPILAYMEKTGIYVDRKKLSELENGAQKERKALEGEIWKLSGEEFDVDSPKQLGHILFDVLKLSTKGIRKTSTKNISTQFSELTKLKGAHPVVELLIRYREVAKLLNTYITALPKLISPDDGRIHTTFNQTGTATGRLSSSNPNLQNIPIRTGLGREIRKAFIAPQGYELISFDYSQIELRIAAALSNEKKLIATFNAGEDVHRRTASEIFNIAPELVTAEMRRRAKIINFGILYGMGARALAEAIGVSASEAEQYLEEYLNDFPKIDEYKKRIVDDGRKMGYVETLFGRRRYLVNLRSSFDFVRKEAERMAVNAPIQGTSADLIKRAMVEIFKQLNLGVDNTEIRMLLQVHDELLFEIKKERIKELVPKVKRMMETVPELAVPIIVDVKHGANWQDVVPYD